MNAVHEFDEQQKIYYQVLLQDAKKEHEEDMNAVKARHARELEEVRSEMERQLLEKEEAYEFSSNELHARIKSLEDDLFRFQQNFEHDLQLKMAEAMLVFDSQVHTLKFQI